MKQKLLIKNNLILLSAICAALSTFSLSIRPVDFRIVSMGAGADKTTIFHVILWKLSKIMPENGINQVLMFFIIFLLFIKVSKDKRIENRVSVALISVILAVCYIIGNSFRYLNSAYFITGSLFQMVVSLIQILGVGLLCYCVILYLFWLLDREWFTASTKIMSGRKVFLKDMAYIFVAWIPYLVIFYPASVPYDGVTQLNMYFGGIPLTNHHPVLSTVMIGVVVRFGQLLGSVRLGLALYAWLQSAALAAAFAYTIWYMRKLGVQKRVRKCAMAFYMFLPIWGAYAQTIMKDTLFIAIFTVYAVMFLESITQSEEFWSGKGKVAGYVMIMILVCLQRNNGIHIIFIAECISFLLVKGKKSKAIKGASLAAVVLVYMGCTKGLYPSLGIPQGSKGEMLSLPIQQTARYINEYPEEVTEEEKAAINAVVSYEALETKYNPNNADPTKNSFRNGSVTDEQLKTYLKVWFRMFMKHPGVYFEAAFNQTYAYYYPDDEKEVLGIYQFYIKHELLRCFDFDYLKGSETLRGMLSSYARAFRKIPLLGMLINVGTYTWGFILMIGYLIYKKSARYIIGLLPALLTILVCIASPINGLVRYMLPVMALLPLCIVWSLYIGNAYKKIQE